jgi:hypothetical protein
MHSISKFDIHKVCDDSILIYGSKGCGKSWLIKDLLWHNRHITYGTVLSSKYDTEFYENFIKGVPIHNQFDSNVMKLTWKRQSDLRTHVRESGCAVDRQAFVVMDNCFQTTDWIHDRCVRSAIMLSRTFSLLPILALEQVISMAPCLYASIDYVFVFGTMDAVECKRLYTRYLESVVSYELFCQLIDAHAKEYQCLVICNNVKSYDVAECIFWYKADDHSDFVMNLRCE